MTFSNKDVKYIAFLICPFSRQRKVKIKNVNSNPEYLHVHILLSLIAVLKLSFEFRTGMVNDRTRWSGVRSSETGCHRFVVVKRVQNLFTRRYNEATARDGQSDVGDDTLFYTDLS